MCRRSVLVSGFVSSWCDIAHPFRHDMASYPMSALDLDAFRDNRAAFVDGYRTTRMEPAAARRVIQRGRASRNAHPLGTFVELRQRTDEMLRVRVAGMFQHGFGFAFLNHRACIQHRDAIC